MKGRKGDPALAKAKTDPSTRKSKAQKAAAAIDARVKLAEERAAQFAAKSSTAEMPAFMVDDKQYAGVAAIWRYHADLLNTRNFWGPAFVGPFTGFCIYYDEFLAADREVKSKGWGVEGTSTSGGQRFWRNPAVDVRDHAFARVMELSTRYGFTPLDMYKLERESAAAGGGRGAGASPPGGQLPLGKGDGDATEPPAPADPTTNPGAMAAFDSAPPPGHYKN